MSKVLLITGATGKQGGAVIDALIDQKVDCVILAVTRDASSAGAKKLVSKASNIKLVQGNLDDSSALFAAAIEAAAPSPIWGVYSVQISLGKGVTKDSEIAQGIALIDEAIKHNVGHFVYSSVERGGDEASWDTPTPVPHFQSKQRIEQHLRDATALGTPGDSMAWTVLRPVAFMDNLAPGMPTKVFLTALRDALQGKTTQWVAVHDIGVFAALAFANPDEWRNVAMGLAGDELSFGEMSELFQRTTGYPVPSTYWFFGSALMYMLGELNTMITWFATDGYKADVAKCRQKNPKMMDLENWLRKESEFQTKDE